MLTNDEWDLLRDLIPILGPFEEVTRYLGGSNYSTHSIMKPLITKIIDNLKPESESSTTNIDRPMQTSEILEEVKKTLYYAMLFYWKKDRMISYLPSILDPRIKKLDFAPDEMRQTRHSLQDKYNDMKLNMSLYTQPSSPSSDLTTTPFLSSTPSPTLYQLTLFNIFNHPSPNNNQSELDEYLAVPQIPFNSDSFSW